MLGHLKSWAVRKVVDWLNQERGDYDEHLCDMDRLCYEIRPADVILVEGRSRVSDVIKLITQSPWTHSALYIGRLYDIEHPDLREAVQYFYDGDPDEQLIIEALLGQGTIVAPITKYRGDHLRICRPKGLSPADAQTLIAHTVKQLGSDYNIRQLLDLARFVFPYAVLPRRWRSSLFQHNAGQPTRTVCSSLIAEAFEAVDYPILPFLERDEHGAIRLIRRNWRLFTPKDFDYSPYFDIIKYPCLGVDNLTAYRQLPWSDASLIYNDGVVHGRQPPAKPALTTEKTSQKSRLGRLCGVFLPRHG
ncbi:MAG: hypothetical protein KDH88_06325 [Chromatiales bacterium]|nr:hypothetical protein [Chromatiales bacterium]